MLDSHQQTVTHWFYLLRSLADEVSTLAATRLQLTMEAYSALAACRSPEELIDCNRRIASKMTEHCSEEIAKLSQMTMRMVTRTEPDAH
jgi:hypothetical protein